MRKKSLTLLQVRIEKNFPGFSSWINVTIPGVSFEIVDDVAFPFVEEIFLGSAKGARGGKKRISDALKKQHPEERKSSPSP